MKKFFLMLALATIVILATILQISPAFAGGLGDIFGGVKGWIDETVIAAVLSFVLGNLTGGLAVFTKVTSSLKAAGELLTTAGTALEDSSLSTNEIADIVTKAKSLIAVWKKSG